MKSYRHLIPIIGFPLFVICGIIAWFFTQPLVQFYKIHWLALLFALIIAFSPWGNKRLIAEENELPRHKPWAWLARIVFLQVCFLALFLAICTVCGRTAPALTSAHAAAFQQTTTQLLVYEGLFPWAFFALMAVMFGYLSYCRRQDAYLATTLDPLIQNSLAIVSVDFLGRTASIIAYASTFALVGLLWASVLTTTPIVTGFSLTPILVSTILMVITLTKIFRRNVTRALGKEIPLIPGLFSWVIFLAVGIWLINGFLAPLTNITLAPPTLLNHWINQPWLDLWMIFANSWWLLWMPLMGAFIARISRGYKIREVILAVLALPFIGSLALGFTRHLSWEISPLVVIFIAALGLLGLLLITLRKRVTPMVVLCYLPQQDHYKFRSYRSTFIKVIQIAVIFLFIYLPGGMTLVQYFTFTITLPLLLIFAIGLAGIFTLYLPWKKGG